MLLPYVFVSLGGGGGGGGEIGTICFPKVEPDRQHTPAFGVRKSPQHVIERPNSMNAGSSKTCSLYDFEGYVRRTSSGQRTSLFLRSQDALV